MDSHLKLQLLFAIPVLLLTAWFYTAAMAQSRFPTLRNKAIVLLIAHPDDEAMFFAPTILGLLKPELGNHLKILCLSSGTSNNLSSTQISNEKRRRRRKYRSHPQERTSHLRKDPRTSFRIRYIHIRRSRIRG